MLLRDKPWDRNLQLLLAGIIGFNLLPHISVVPAWVTLLSFTCIAWKILYLTKGFRLPRKSVLTVVSVMGVIGVLFSFGTILGQEAAGAMLVIMACIKLLETNRYRDAMLVIFTSYFLLMAFLLNNQSLLSTVYMAIDLGLITFLMSQVHHREKRTLGSRNLKPALTLIALTFPLWVFLFIFFPRFSTGIWNTKPPNQGVGFSDNLDPGSVASLASSNEPAFRVTFNSRPDFSPESTYWRGSVLMIGDGLKWSRSRQRIQPDTYLPERNDRIQVYSVSLEPSFEKWLFALDVPLAISSEDLEFLEDVTRLPGFFFETLHPRFNRTFYTARSAINAPPQILNNNDRSYLLKLPTHLNSKIIDLANQLKNRALRDSSDQEFIDQRYSKEILEWFWREKFRYSKSPGVLSAVDGTDQLDEFLFKKRVGFCEHYSATFATLMRVMGIPSRVVVGFQGARPNALGGYWVVKKMDAHAWVEVWRDEPQSSSQKKISTETKGRWVRVDPTEAIAPQRLQLGGDFNNLEDKIASGMSGEELRKRLHGGVLGSLEKLEFLADFLQMKWNAFLIAYDRDYQLKLLNWFGFSKNTGYILAVIVMLGGLTIGFLLIFIQRRKAKAEDPLARMWRHFCDDFARLGFARQPNEGPLDFSIRVAIHFPKDAKMIREIADFYACLRYGMESSSAGEQKALKNEFSQLVRKFSISSKSPSARS